MRIKMIAVIAMCVFGLAAVAPAQEDAAAKRQELQQKQRELRDKLNQLRMKLSREPDLADAQKAMMEVRKAADEKVMTDPKVQAARKAADEAQKAVREVTDQQVAASAEVAAARKAMEVADDHLFELDAQKRLTNFQLNELKRRALRDPEIKKLGAESMRTQSALHDATRNDAAVLAAQKKLDDLRRAAGMRPTKDQQEAIAAAQKEVAAAREASKEVAAATAADDTADKALMDALQAKLSTSGEAKELTVKLADLDAKIKAAQEARQGDQKKLDDARMKIQRNDPKVADARKKAEPAEAEFRKAKSEAMGPGREAVDKTQKEFDAKVDAKLAGNTEAAALKTELDAINKQIAELNAPVRKPVAKPN